MRQRRGAITGASNSSSINTASTFSSTHSNNNNSTGNMSSFSFGGSPAAPGAANPAPAPSAFSFGGAPAPAGGANPAPAPSAFSFGGAPAPAPGAPAPSAFSFGGAPAPGAPAPAPSLFGGTPAPASAFGAPAPASGGFGAPAPSAFGAPASSAFGAPAPAPGSSLFGGSSFGTSAPAPGSSLFGAPAQSPGGSLFGGSALAGGFQQPAAQQPMPTLVGNASYSSLPQDQKQMIDRLYGEIMQHKRTMCAVQVMHPRLLEKTPQQADAAAGQELPLAMTVREIAQSAQQLDQKLKDLKAAAIRQKQLNEKTSVQAVKFAQWPAEFTAARMGVAVAQEPRAATTEEAKKREEFRQKFQILLDQELTRTDQVELMPSPFLWQTIEEMEERCRTASNDLYNYQQILEGRRQTTPQDIGIVPIVELQDTSIQAIGARIMNAHAQADQLRRLYSQCETGTNVLQQARYQEQIHQQNVNAGINQMKLKALPASTTAPAPGGFGAPAPAGGSLFGASAPGGSLFGSAPAPSGSLFGSTPAPAPGSSLFGGTPAPAPGGSLFGGTPAPAPGGSLFGGTPAAPAPGGSLFGSTPAPGAPAPGAPAPSAFGTPSSGSLFGNTGASTPAPAPAGGLSFGGTPAAAPAGGAPAMPSFGASAAPSTTPLFNPTASTPKSKNKSSRGTRRR